MFMLTQLHANSIYSVCIEMWKKGKESVKKWIIARQQTDQNEQSYNISNFSKLSPFPF